MNYRSYFILAMCVAVASAASLDCWGEGADCLPAVTRYDRLRVHTMLVAGYPNGTSSVIFSGIHFPNVDGQPPGKLTQLQFRGSFSQVTGCKCPAGDCTSLLAGCSACQTSPKLDCALTPVEVKACVDKWLQNGVCGVLTPAPPAPPPPPPPILEFVDNSQTFLQISFGRNNYLSNTSASSNGAVGLPGWMFRNPLKATGEVAADTPLRNYAFANNKALTALVQIDSGAFSFAEWNWEKDDTRCKSPSNKDGRIRAFYENNLFNPCGRNTDNPCINNLLCTVTFDYCLLSMMIANTKDAPGVVSPECDLTISLAWQGTDANKRYCSSQNQMFSKFNALGLDNLLSSALSGGSDISSDINSKLKS